MSEEILSILKTFPPLEKGKIHLYCTGCGLKKPNMDRDEVDPNDAVLYCLFCPACVPDEKDDATPIAYYNKDGEETYLDFDDETKFKKVTKEEIQCSKI